MRARNANPRFSFGVQRGGIKLAFPDALTEANLRRTERRLSMRKATPMQREFERSAPVSGRRAIAATRRTQLGILISAVLTMPALVLAQSPWERAASNLELTFTGPLARSLALVAIVIGGLLFMFAEQGAKRQISGIVFGGGLALFAGQFLAWLF
jgi:type IV secretory pathway VirB2 component (pilin)